MNDAQRKRQQAIGMLTELYLPTPIDGDYDSRPLYLINYHAARYATGDEIADNIIKLAQLGRTPRWKNAITLWAASVRNSQKLTDIRFTFLQGLINASHASD